MTEFDGPGGLSLSGGDADKYAMWDAAYVLGSLSSAERREYEAHLSTCPLCREAVTEISGMPALISETASRHNGQVLRCASYSRRSALDSEPST